MMRNFRLRVPDELPADRRLVTTMFADLSGFTALAESMDPEELRDLMADCFEALVPVVERYGGTIDKFIGDEVMALFGAPVAHEDDPERALRAALEMMEALAAFNARRATQLGIHCGINTGLVLAGGVGVRDRQGYSVLGDPVNLASRLADLATTGEILVGPDTHRLTNSLFDFQPLGPHQFKGKAEDVPVYRLVGARSPASLRRGLSAHGIGSPLVGRDGEVATLTGCVDRLLAGHGGLVSIIAEAGLGKSRLVAEVRRQSTGRGVAWLEGRALSFSQNLSYLPFLEILQTDAGITLDDHDTERWVKLERRVRALFPEDAVEVLPYLATLLSLGVPCELAERVKYLDSEGMGRQLFRTARRYFSRLAQERPLVLVFEDIHWLDQSSAALVEHLFPLMREVPLLICGVGRRDPETLLTRLPEIAPAEYSDRYTEIDLAPLSPEQRIQLVWNLMDRGDLPVHLQESILQKTEGNPFFIEEVIRALVDLGGLTRDRLTGRWQVTKQVERITIPDSLQAVIMARIDRLDEDARETLKLASVVGRSFFYRVLESLAEAEGELDRQLSELERLELVREKRRLPDLEYIFKHALVQETAYESILIQRRRALHRRVGEQIESLFADRLEEFYGLLAYHYSRSEEWEKAQEYLLKAGDQASRVAADTEALAHYRQALAAYARAFGERWDPVQRAVLERRIGEALFRRGDHKQAQEYLLRALALLGSPYPSSRRGIRRAILAQIARQVAHRILPRWFVRSTSGTVDRAAEERCRQYEMMKWIDFFAAPEPYSLDALLMLNVAEESGLLPDVAQGAAGIGTMLDALPMSRLAERYHHYALALAERTQHPWAIGHGHLFMAIHDRSLTGRWESALSDYRKGAAAFWQAGYLRGWAGAQVLAAELLLQQGKFSACRDLCLEIIRVGQDAADHQSWGWGLCFLAAAQDRQGAPAEAAVNLRQAVDLLRRVPDHQSTVHTFGDLARCLLRLGRLPEALAALEEGLQLARQHGLRGFLCVPLWVSLAEARLADVQRAGKDCPPELWEVAGQACRQALRQGRLDVAEMVRVYRLQGSYEWMRGKAGPARKWWHRSIGLAEKLGARYEMGLTHLEAGRRLGDTVHLQRAEVIFAGMGARLDLEEAQGTLRAIKGSAAEASRVGG